MPQTSLHLARWACASSASNGRAPSPFKRWVHRPSIKCTREAVDEPRAKVLSALRPPPMMSKRATFLLLLLCFCIPAAAQFEEFVFEGFAGSAAGGNISLNGVSEIEPGGILRLTNDTNRLIGRAFFQKPLRFKNATDGTAFSFSTSFAFAMKHKYPKLGGHGLAFTIAPTKEFMGALPSQYLGLLNASDVGNATNHIFAVEFDTVQSFEFGDINDNHVGVDINSLKSNSSAAAAYYGDDGVKHELNLKGGRPVLAWVDYDGAAKLLHVTLSPSSTKPKTPLISFPMDLSPVLRDHMFVGFSASTGLLANSHYLLGWSFKMNGAVVSLDLSSLPSLPENRIINAAFIVAVTSSALALLIVVVAAGVYIFYRIKNADIIQPWELTCSPHRFAYKDLKRATQGFRDKKLLGFGGFGKVYRGTLPGTGADVAVKRLNNRSTQGLREFVTEVAIIARLRHRNLVELKGWCRRRSDLLLVYDYMPNGSLDKFLFSSSEEDNERRLLSWPQRLRVLQGVGSALLYLHEEWEDVVVHRDVKASNVLLDADLNGRLGDFGLAKLHQHGANLSTTRVVGTLGYLAPELTRTGKSATSSDVFAFGALMLETVCGRRPIEPKAVPEELVLVDWVWERWSAGAWTDVVDSRLAGDYDREEVAAAIKVGLWCSHASPPARPTMRDVVRYLHSSKVAEVPDVPLHSYPSSSEKASRTSSPVMGSNAMGPTNTPLHCDNV